MYSMELQLTFLAMTILLVISTIFFLTNTIKLIKRSNNKKLPPGPWKLPIIGNLHYLAIGSLPPHHILRNLSKRYGPLMHLQLGGMSTIVVSSPRMAKMFLKTHESTFLNRPNLFSTDIFFYNRSEIGFTPYGDHWRQMRKICVGELLSNKRVQSFHIVREDEVSNLVEFIRKSVGSPIDLSAPLFSLSSSVICRAAFGEKFSGQNKVGPLVHEAALLMGTVALGDIFPSVKFLDVVSGMKSKVEKVHKEIDITFSDIIKKRQEYNATISESGKGRNDMEALLDVFLRLRQENKQEFPITYDNIKASILELLMAATETAASVIEWAMCEMIKNPTIMKKAQSEVRLSLDGIKNVKESDTQGLHYLNLIIQETIRLHPTGPLLIPRVCAETCVIDGYTIPVNSRVLINTWAIGRDPGVWEDAEKFIPERFEKNMWEYKGKNFEFIPFGAGRRICPGISFAVSTVELVLAQLIFHFNWKLPNQIKPEELDMNEADGISTRRRNPLILIANFNQAMPAKN